MPLTHGQDAVDTSAAVYVDEAGLLQLRGHRNLLTNECIRRSTVLSEMNNSKVNDKDVLALDVALPVGDAIATAWIAAIQSDDKSLANISARQFAMTLMVGNVIS